MKFSIDSSRFRHINNFKGEDSLLMNLFDLPILNSEYGFILVLIVYCRITLLFPLISLSVFFADLSAVVCLLLCLRFICIHKQVSLG